jgi:hypothetical protein
VLTLAINNVAQKEEDAMKTCENIAEFQAYATPSRLRVMLEPSFPGLSVNL